MILEIDFEVEVLWLPVKKIGRLDIYNRIDDDFESIIGQIDTKAS